MKRTIILIIFTTLSLCACHQNARHYKAEEIAISRAMEQAIELGEKIVSEKELIENVALTQGTEAAVRFYDSIGHRDNIELFWVRIRQLEELCNHVADTLAQKKISAHLYPYATRLDELMNQKY
ncbi:MAG: hypothetical protein IJ222_10510 [Bacteroidales bacterium]|nr:hypothetical protein [Bacteroidales bacterium]